LNRSPTSASTAAGCPVEAYIESRGLFLPEIVAGADAIRFHPRCPYRSAADGSVQRATAMVSLMCDPASGEPRAIHRTFLTEDVFWTTRTNDRCCGSGNGKSVFLYILRAILKDYAVTATMDTFAAARGERHPTELAKLHGYFEDQDVLQQWLDESCRVDIGNTARIERIAGPFQLQAFRRRAWRPGGDSALLHGRYGETWLHPVPDGRGQDARWRDHEELSAVDRWPRGTE